MVRINFASLKLEHYLDKKIKRWSPFPKVTLILEHYFDKKIERWSPFPIVTNSVGREQKQGRFFDEGRF